MKKCYWLIKLFDIFIHCNFDTAEKLDYDWSVLLLRYSLFYWQWLFRVISLSNSCHILSYLSSMIKDWLCNITIIILELINSTCPTKFNLFHLSFL